jgi:hypothetical protein
MPIKSIVRLFSHLYRDGIPQEQPDHTYTNSYGTTKKQADHALSYISSDTANKISVCLPEGADLRGCYELEEEDVFITFILNGGQSEVGVVDYKRKQYMKVMDDSSSGLDMPLGFSPCVWTDIDVNYVSHCNNIHIYFQTDNVYRVINITDPCCDYTDTKLCRPKCVAVAKVVVIDGMGRLANGSYKVSVRVKDSDGNPTNYSITSQPLSVAHGDFRPGEEGKGALAMEIADLPKEYSLADIVIIGTIDSKKTYRVIENVGYGNGYLRYTYTGVEGYVADGDDKLTELTSRIKHNYNGADHESVDGRLVLFNVEPERDWSLQQYVNKMEVFYKRWAVPMSEAKNYKGLKANEMYIPAIGFNFDDGTRTKAFEFINHMGQCAPIGEQCGTCAVPTYQDTSQRTKLYITDANELSKAFQEQFSNSNEKFEFDNNITPKIDPRDTSTESATDPGNIVDPPTTSGDEGDVQGFLTPGDEEALDYADEYLDCANCNRSFLDNLIIAIADFFGANSSLYMDCWHSPIDCAREQALPNANKNFAKIDADTKTPSDKIKYIDTQIACSKEGEIRCSGQTCYECQGGKWKYVNNAYHYDKQTEYKRDNKNKTFPSGQSLRGDIQARGTDTNGFSPNILGSDLDCVSNIIPIPYSEGIFGCGLTNQLYPDIVDKAEEGCPPVYREWAGKNVRGFRVPSLTKEPHYVSLRSGVENKYDVINTPDGDTFAIFTGLSIKKIMESLPDEFKKRLCKANPFTIYYAPRTEQNKTNIGNNLMIGTYSGLIQGETALFGKLGVNSLEYYDKDINPGGNNTFRRGSASTVPAYILHGSDIHLWGKRTDGDYLLIEQETFGCGWRFKQYSEGRPAESPFESKLNLAGTTQSISLNHFQPPIGSDGGPILRCLKAMKYAPADSIVTKDNKFTHTLVNTYRESSMYVEIDGSKIALENGSRPLAGSLNGSDGADDLSFIGDTIDHESLIGDSRAWNVTTMKYLPNQYGSSINRVYIPIGLHGDSTSFDTGEVEGICGDSFTGPFSVKRSAFVSDKVPEEISPSGDFGSVEIEVDIPIIGGVISDLLTSIARSILKVAGFEECGTVPMTGDKDDVRNALGSLRRGMRAITDKDGAGLLPPSEDGIIIKLWFITITLQTPPDAYFPHLLKTLVRTYLQSDANLHYRAAGAIRIGDYKNLDFGTAEVHQDRLKTLKLDSSFPEGTDYELGWLDRIAFFMEEPPRWKMILRMILNIIWVYGPGFFFIYQGIIAIYTGLSKIGSGFFFAGSVGAGLAVGFGIALIAAGIIWIKDWANSDLDNKVIDSILGLEWCRPDRKMPDGPGGDFAMDPGRAKGFEDNHYNYDVSHSDINYEGFIFGMPLNYDTQVCEGRYSSKIIMSDQQVLESHLDSWRNFKPNQLLTIPRDRGQISRLIYMQNVLSVHTTDSIFHVPFKGQRLQLDSTEILLGQANLFGEPVDIYGGAITGYGGNKDPNASKITARGYFYIDRDARRFKMYTGRQDTDITFKGLEDFMDENLRFKILDDVPDFSIVDQKCKDGVYFDIGIDYAKDIIYLYKYDFSCHPGTTYSDGKFMREGSPITLGDPVGFKDESFLVSFSIKNQYYLSFHLYRPDLFLFNRFELFSLSESIIYTHFVQGRFNEYYGQLTPVYVEIPIVDKETYQNWIVRNFMVVGEVLQHNGDVVTELDIPLFEKFSVHNGRQSTGWLDFRDLGIDTDENLLNDINETDEIKFRMSTNRIVVEEFKNQVPDGISPLNKYNSELKIYEAGDLQKEQKGVFNDDYVVIRLLSLKPANVEVIFRRLILSIDTEDM